MHAFFAVKGRNTCGSGGNRLAAAQLDADLRAALFAQLRIKKDDVIRVARGGLDFPAEEQRVLVGDEQLAVVRDGWPAATLPTSS